MVFAPSQAGYSSLENLIIAFVVIFLCVLYSIGLLYIAWQYVWLEKIPPILPTRNTTTINTNVPVINDLSHSSPKNSIQQQQQKQIVDIPINEIVVLTTNNSNGRDDNKNGDENEPVSPIAKRSPSSPSSSVSLSSSSSNLNKKISTKIKCIVILYILSCELFGICLLIEQMINAFSTHPITCPRASYSYALRGATNSCYFMFYIARIQITLQDTIYTFPKFLQRCLLITPSIVFFVWTMAYLSYMHINHCQVPDIYYYGFILVGLFIEIFWNVTLFVLFYWKLHQLTEIGVKSGDGLTEDLKRFMKKLFRLFIFTECMSVILYIVSLLPSSDNLVKMTIMVELCLVETAILLSFKFAQPFYNYLCLCQSQK